MLLEGKVGYVVGGLRQMMTKRDLKVRVARWGGEVAGEPLSGTAGMKYDEVPCGGGIPNRQWRSRGGVSASGERPIGACRYAMAPGRRTSDAQSARDVPQRGVGLPFWVYHVEQEDERLYGKLGKTG